MRTRQCKKKMILRMHFLEPSVNLLDELHDVKTAAFMSKLAFRTAVIPKDAVVASVSENTDE